MRVPSEAGLVPAPGQDTGGHWTGQLRVTDLPAGTCSIARGARDGQEPHRFVDVTDDLSVRVLFAPAEYSRRSAGG
jgi:hypothetical protein